MSEPTKTPPVSAKAGKKRSFKQVKSNFATPWSPQKGESIEGEYIGFDKIPVTNKKAGKEFFKSHRIKVENQEEPVGIAGAFIDTKMIRIPVGTYVRVTYLGKIESAGGMAHDYNVECEEGVILLDGRDSEEAF